MRDKSISAWLMTAGGAVAGIGGVCDLAQSDTPCDMPAVAFIDVHPYGGFTETVEFRISGAAGLTELTFTSGVAIPAIIESINRFAQDTGVQAADTGGMRVQLRGFSVDVDPFVSVEQIAGTQPLIYPVDSGGKPVWRLIAHGENGLAGDVNCDSQVNVQDLLGVFQHWGPCSTPWLTCDGDLNFDHKVDVADLLTVIANWGATH